MFKEAKYLLQIQYWPVKLDDKSVIQSILRLRFLNSLVQ